MASNKKHWNIKLDKPKDKDSKYWWVHILEDGHCIFQYGPGEPPFSVNEPSAIERLLGATLEKRIKKAIDRAVVYIRQVELERKNLNREVKTGPNLKPHIVATVDKMNSNFEKYINDSLWVGEETI